MIDYLASRECTDSSSQSIGHHHEESLSRSLDAWIAFLIYKQASGNIEEIECHSIDEARKDKEEHAWEVWTAYAEETETEHPCAHSHHHHYLDAKSLEEEWYKENAESFGYL